MKVQFSTMHHSHNRGDDMTVHADDGDARASLIEVVTLSWDNIWCEDGSDCDVEGCTGVPRDVDSLERDEAIRIYFAHRAAFESFVIESQELDVNMAESAAGLLAQLKAAEQASRATPDDTDTALRAVALLRAAVSRAITELTTT